MSLLPGCTSGTTHGCCIALDVRLEIFWILQDIVDYALGCSLLDWSELPRGLWLQLIVQCLAELACTAVLLMKGGEALANSRQRSLYPTRRMRIL